MPCEREHDDLIRFQEAHAERNDATVLAVLFDDEVDDAQRFFERRGGDWPVLQDPGGRVSLDFGVRGPPESFLISPDGIVLSRIIGEVSSEGLDRLVERAEALRAEARETDDLVGARWGRHRQDVHPAGDGRTEGGHA